jgi:hypothetical protein
MRTGRIRYPAAETNMHMIACSRPMGRLEPAPLTALLPGDRDPADEWSGFWGEDDGYYVRLRTVEGVRRWFRIDPTADPSVVREAGLAPSGQSASLLSPRARAGNSPRSRLAFLIRVSQDRTRISAMAAPLRPIRRRPI